MKLQIPRLPEFLVHFSYHVGRPLASCTAIVLLFLLSRPTASGADHRDGGFITTYNQALDLNDLFIFRDPNDNTQVVLIATVHAFIVPGEAPDEAAFASGAVYRFEIYNEHVNLESPMLDPEATRSEQKAFLQKVKPNRVIDVTFNKREVGPEPQSNATGGTIPSNLRRPKPQEATLRLQGFKGIDVRTNRGRFDRNNLDQPLTVSPMNSGRFASPFKIHTIEVSPGVNIELFAGMTDDPFFADQPALANFLDSIRNGAPSTSAFSRGRDTFAGYNTMSIALRVPAVLLQGESGTKIGANAVALRPAIQRVTKSGVKDSGTLRAIDRVGVPLVTTLLIPYDLKDTYNMSNVAADGSVRFLRDSIQLTLAELGLATNPPEPAVVELSKLLLTHGDLLQLDLSIPNTGTNSAAAFPNGRRLHDDTTDYVLTAVNHSATLGDNVNANEFPPNFTFPFLPLPHQPVYTGDVDDRTRN